MGKNKKRKRSSRSRDRSSERSRSKSPDDVKRRLKFIEETLRFLVKDAEKERPREKELDSSPRIDNSPLPENSENLNERTPVSTENAPQTIDKENTPPNKEAAPKSNLADEKTDEVSILDEYVHEKMGEDPTAVSKKDHEFHPELTRRWNSWLTNGLKAGDKEKILNKYSKKGSCTLEAPIVNKELIKAIPETTLKRDEHFMHTQNSIGSALSALGSAISMITRLYLWLLCENDGEVDRLDLLEKLLDTGKILTDIFHTQSKARKAFISPTFNSIKPLLDKASTDQFLYGEKIGENIKDDTALEKLRKMIRPSKSQQKVTSENREGPLAAQRQVGQAQKFKPNRFMKFKYRSKDTWKSNQNRRPYQNAPYQSASQQSVSNNRRYNAKK